MSPTADFLRYLPEFVVGTDFRLPQYAYYVCYISAEYLHKQCLCRVGTIALRTLVTTELEVLINRLPLDHSG